jgi:hypothetical protein
VKTALLAMCVLVGGCSTVGSTNPTAADQFFEQLSQHCGKSFGGKLVAGDDSDAAFANADMRAHFRVCTASEMQIAFDVGEDRSRTWIITRVGDRLRLKHRHMLKDGSEDPVSQYGGDTLTSGTVVRQEFPADDYSKAMFTREGRTVSNSNVWAFEIVPRASFTYELSRPNRLFRVEFDTTAPIQP